MATCVSAPDDRRRPFWTWQPAACGTASNGCDDDCGVPGLELQDGRCFDGCGRPACAGDGPIEKTIATNDYVRSLILGTLLTRGRKPDQPCGRRPGEGGGHWSDTFRRGNARTGSRLYYGPPASARAAEIAAWLKSVVALDLAYLTADGLVTAIKVAVSYAGGGQFEATISWTEPAGGSGVVGIAGGRVGKAWIWNGVPAA